MASQILLIFYAILLIFQSLHIFKEIGMDAYKFAPVGSRKKYLRIASIIMTIYILSYSFIILDFNFLPWLGIACSLIATGNLIVYSIGLIKEEKYIGNLASGVFSSIPLGLFSIIILIILIHTV